MSTRPLGIAGAALLVAAAGAAALGASCGGAPTPPPVRTFLRAQKVDFVCLKVNDASGSPLSGGPFPAGIDQCAPVPPNVNGALFAFHEYALVTQTTRGELAVVDLTASGVVDEYRSFPGINFIPVGASPTDVAVTPDGARTYVTSADPRLPAVYGIDNHLLLGDSTRQTPPLYSFTQIASCVLGPDPNDPGNTHRLPFAQAPDAIAVVKTPNAGGGGGDAGNAAGPPTYALALLLRAQGSSLPAQVAVIEPPTALGGTTSGGAFVYCNVLGVTGPLASSLAGATAAPGPPWSDGVVFDDAGALAASAPSPGPVCMSPPGAGTGTNPPSGTSVDAGTDAPAGPQLEAGSDATAALDAGAADAGAASPEAGDSGDTDGAPGDASPDGPDSAHVPLEAGSSQAPPPVLGPPSDPRPTSMVLRDGSPPVLYVADGAVPVIHVIDLSNPAQPREVSSLLATSQAQPTRTVSIGGIALSPATRDYKRYLYAVDVSDGTLMVFDVTDPVPPRFSPPLERPHAELNPFAPRDRLVFPAPVTAVTFAFDDWPVPRASGAAAGKAETGLLCNPNPNARIDGGAVAGPNAAGAFYCADQAAVIQPQGAGVQGFPNRLRGWFAFATLSNGALAVIDLDDWDAPCRRPDPMTSATRTGVLDLPEPPATGATDLDPYHVPIAHLPNGAANFVTQEAFFPVSAPNRQRSSFLLRTDPTSGDHIPNVLVTPQLVSGTGAPVSIDPSQPVILPTRLASGFVDPSTYTNPTDPLDNYSSTPPINLDAATRGAGADAGDAGSLGASSVPGSADTVPGVRVSFDDPTAHVDQDWSVTYEGALPTTSPLVADMVSDDFQTLTFSMGIPAPAADAGEAEGGAVASGRVAGGGFCKVGVEDFAIGHARASLAVAAMTQAGLPAPTTLPEWTSDYVEITDDLLPPNDCYWQEATKIDGGASDSGLSQGCLAGSGLNASQPANQCWAALGDKFVSGKDVAANRYNICAQTFGSAAQADTQLLRDFPVLEAYEGKLVVGRFKWQPVNPACPDLIPEKTTNRSVVPGPDPNNTAYFNLAQCCFHHQAGFKIRTGGEWVAVGQNGLGLLHHVVTEPKSGRCILSCDPRDALLNARAFDIPYGQGGQCAPPSARIDRNSPLAMRNPMFSFAMWRGCGALDTSEAGAGPMCADFGDHTSTLRDLSWRFSMRGGFSPMTVPLGGAQSVPVIPQSIRPLPNFQQISIVDGADQGLILIDLHTLQIAHTYF